MPNQTYMKIYQTIVTALCGFFIFGCAQMQPPRTKSPTEVLKTLSESSKTKDVAAIKNSVSRGTLKLIEETAKVQNTTVDEVLRKDNAAPFKELPEMRNEKIEGDTATIELKNSTSGGWEAVPFVREDGVWKLAMDKYLEDFRKKITQNMKMPSPVSNNSNSNAPESGADKKPKETENKSAKSKN